MDYAVWIKASSTTESRRAPEQQGLTAQVQPHAGHAGLSQAQDEARTNQIQSGADTCTNTARARGWSTTDGTFSGKNRTEKQNLCQIPTQVIFLCKRDKMNFSLKKLFSPATDPPKIHRRRHIKKAMTTYNFLTRLAFYSMYRLAWLWKRASSRLPKDYCCLQKLEVKWCFINSATKEFVNEELKQSGGIPHPSAESN